MDWKVGGSKKFTNTKNKTERKIEAKAREK
jgi:hypothetical protein